MELLKSNIPLCSFLKQKQNFRVWITGRFGECLRDSGAVTPLAVA